MVSVYSKDYDVFYIVFSCYSKLINLLLNSFPVEDVSDLWPLVKKGFEERLPLQGATLNNKTRNPVFLENLPVEFILTTDARLRSRFPHELSLFWFREPYATVVLVTCEVTGIFVKPCLLISFMNGCFMVFVC